MAEYRPDPQRDRVIARQERRGPRKVALISDALDQVFDRSAKQRMRRYGKAVQVMREYLPVGVLDRIRPMDLRAGTLTVAVPDALLLAELTQHYGASLQNALVAAGTGITKVRFIRERSNRKA